MKVCYSIGLQEPLGQSPAVNLAFLCGVSVVLPITEEKPQSNKLKWSVGPLRAETLQWVPT